MLDNQDTVIGVVGGMGPEAGTDLVSLITQLTDSTNDQEHKSVMLMSFPAYLPDRTAFLEGRVSINPAYNIAKVIQKLDKAGAGVIGIACNTSHIPGIFDVVTEEVQALQVEAKVLHMPYETCEFIRKRLPIGSKVGIMSTNGTYRSGLYQQLLTEAGFSPVSPDEDFQQNIIHELIYHPVFGLKSVNGALMRESKEYLKRIISYFKTRGAEAIILGCTEFSLILKEPIVDGMHIINSNEVLARALIAASDASTAGARKKAQFVQG